MKLKHKMIVLFVSIIFILNFGMGFYSTISMQNKVIGAAQEKLKSDAALGKTLLDNKYPGEWSIKNNSLYKGNVMMNNLFEIVDEIGKLTGDTVTIFQGDTRVATNVIKPDGNRAINTQASEEVINTVLKEGGTYIGKANVVGTWNQTVYEPIRNTNNEIIGIWYVGVPNTIYDQLAADFRNKLILFTVIALIIASIFVWIVTDRISRPLSILEKATHKIAAGDLTDKINVISNDEVGSLANAFNKMVDNMNSVLTNIASASEQVASGSKQVSVSSMSLSQGATEQASTIQELTSSLEELSSKTNLTATSANDANDLTEKVKSKALKSNMHMNEMLQSMKEISDSSRDISKIIKVIDEIAFQTNILALNAAVEAAQAGQYGKGFAVVAEEVKNLASRSSEAAKETTSLIEGSINKVSDGTKIANETANALNEIVEGVSKVANLVNDIAIASNEQASGIDQINIGIKQVTDVVQSTSATSEETAAASEELSGQAEILNQQVKKFNLRHMNL